MTDRGAIRRGVAMAALALLGGLGACGRTEAADAPQAAARPAQTRWATFTDPVEHAFTLQVPAGWQVTGGVRRMSALEIRTGVVMRSPDGSMELFFGDTGVPIFAMPTALMASLGLREGMNYSPGYGQNLTIGAYQPGASFAGNWGRQRVASVCPGATGQGARALPTATRDIDAVYARAGISTSIQAGEANFGCSWRGAPGAGYVFAATEQVSNGAGGVWQVKSLAGFAGRADRAGEAMSLLAHVAGSFHVDEAWAARNQQTVAQVSRIVAGTNAAVSRSIIEAGQNRQAGMDRAAERQTQARRGTATFVDPVEGRRELTNAPHQWRLPNGAVVSTEGSAPPMPGAVELQRVPPGR